MTALLTFLLALALVGLLCTVILWLRETLAARRTADDAEKYRVEAESRRRELEVDIEKLNGQVARLTKWSAVADADDKARELIESAQATLAQAEADARILITNAEAHYTKKLAEAEATANETTTEARAKAKSLREEAQAARDTAIAHAAQIVADANLKAEQIAGKAYDAVRNAELYERTVGAMRRIIEGYGDEYLKPAESVLDELALDLEHTDAGRALKNARDYTKALIKSSKAAVSEYVESHRAERAAEFVLDAFNGKVDSILSRVKHDNYGKLEQSIRDAFSVVNYGGKAFRRTRITDEFLAARLDELKWAVAAQELKRQEAEEQRRIREQIREEEKARREYERAMREAGKEEEILRKAMAKAQAKIDAATEEQRVQYEAQLAELQAQLQKAEERGQRAISMAQLTRRGHVYIISNVGSLGENVYKIGLTRRLEPLDRVRELGDSSVPFDFDVHAMILSDDAPALECQLHKHFVLNQVNKVNHRREFFRANLAEIRREIENLGIVAKWTMVAQAREYRETIAIERAIETDPAARDAWINRQLTLDPVDYLEMNGSATDSDRGSDVPEERVAKPIHEFVERAQTVDFAGKMEHCNDID